MNRTKFDIGVVYDMAMQDESLAQQKARIKNLLKFAYSPEHIVLDRHFPCGIEPTNRIKALNLVRPDVNEVLICYSWPKLVSCSRDVEPMVNTLNELGITVQFYKHSSRKLHPMEEYLDLVKEFKQRQTGNARNAYKKQDYMGRPKRVKDEKKVLQVYNAYMRNQVLPSPVSNTKLIKRSGLGSQTWYKYIRIGACMFAENAYVDDPFKPEFALRTMIEQINPAYWDLYFQTRIDE